MTLAVMSKATTLVARSQFDPRLGQGMMRACRVRQAHTGHNLRAVPHYLFCLWELAMPLAPAFAEA